MRAASEAALEASPVAGRLFCTRAAPVPHEVCGERGEASGGLVVLRVFCWRRHTTGRCTCYISGVFFCVFRRAYDLSERDAEHGIGQARGRRWCSYANK